MARGSIRMLQFPLSEANCSKGRCCNFIRISGNPFRPRLFTHLFRSLPFQPPFDSSESDHPLRASLSCFRFSLYFSFYIPLQSLSFPRPPSPSLSRVLSRRATVLSRPRNRSRVIYLIFEIHPFLFSSPALYTLR